MTSPQSISQPTALNPGTILLFSGLAGIGGWLPVHPFDVLKTRMQLAGECKNQKSGCIRIATNIFRTEGIAGFYSGISAGVARQATYTTLRAGLYQIFRDNICPNNTPSLYIKGICGLMSGAIASTICCPVEVSLIRMQADGRLPINQRRGYKNVFDAIFRIIKEEGLHTCWRGSTPTIVRAMTVNMVQLASYDHAKTYIYDNFKFDGIFLHLSASLISGFLYSASSLPFDIAKTRMQNQFVDIDGKKEYKNIIQTILKIGKNEGILSLWKGFPPYFLRGGGHTVFMFILLEKLKNLV
eukprot:GHVL01004300.1.p1 GENE.GHVL01004300.1~~GHVL01004300.1.p1  ORF type:complete len:298 (+),score=63.10 GHVL01004300.1:59-952(+)